MSSELAERKIFVHIVESPSPDDIFGGQTEGRVLTEALRLANVTSVYNVVVNVQKLVDALMHFVTHRASTPQALPILHLSMHGNDRGVQLTDGTFLTWEQLRSFIYPASQGKALICMSSCFGYHGCSMAMTEQADLPFLGLIGHSGAVSWSAAAVAYVSFYYRLTCGDPIPKAIEAMQEASGDHNFGGMSASHAQKLFKEQMDQAKSEYFRSLIDEAVAQYIASGGQMSPAS
jgi:hypothetical protein